MRKFMSFLSATLLASLSLVGIADAAGDAERGAVLADTCMGCHGIPGYRNAYPSYRVPKLGGQKEDYLVIALQGYKNGTRAHPTMRAQAASLSDQDMRDLSAYFASQGEPEQGEPVTGGRAAAGKEKITTCTACHGDYGISPAPNWPNLAGQHQEYIAQALLQHQTGERKDPVMMGQVMNLSAQDIQDIAWFFASQPGLFTVHYGR
jgi:cytochrome c553